MAGKVIDMQFMRYINLFGKISRVSTTDCFVYNGTIYFAVPKSLVMQAVGKNGENVKRLSETLRKRIRVISMQSKEKFEAGSDEDKKKILKSFIEEIVSPIEFGALEFVDGVVSITGTREQKAMMIGRDRARQNELQEILSRTFGVRELKFV
jgi:transcription antitermination factor NusA-like protein